MHSPVPSAPSSDKHALTKACQLADGIGDRGGGGGLGGLGGGLGGLGGGGEGATQVLLIVSHELAGPEVPHVYLA